MSVININVGVLGHVDSGKTSLCKALSTTSSTACFDKNPQSKERGITLDLGFSSFRIQNDAIINENKAKLQLIDEDLLFTLVDCPGHASLIRTIICGAKIIDVMILVIDVVRGIQTQTAECLVIGEILCDKVIIAFNKVDLLTDENRISVINKLEKRIINVLSKSKIKSYKIVQCSAVNTSSSSVGLDNLKMALLDMIDNPIRKRLESSRKDPLLYAVDHCFGIRGQGTVLTGTVLSGCMEVGNSLHIPTLDTDKKIKSIQMFKKSVNKAIQGDRVGVCVTQMDPSQLERGLLCLSQSQKPLYIINSCLICLSTIAYYKQPIKSKQSKFHVTIGMETVMGSVTLFSTQNKNTTNEQFDWSVEYVYEHEYSNEIESGITGNSDNKVDTRKRSKVFYALVQLEKPVVCAEKGLLIGSKLDTDIHSNVCRLAFYGNILWMKHVTSNYADDIDLQNLKIFKTKSRSGALERLVDPYTAIVKNLFKKETNIEVFQGLKVRLEQWNQNKSHGDSGSVPDNVFHGVIEGNFGQSGKCKIRLNDELPSEIVEQFSASSSKKKKKQTTENLETIKTSSIRVVLDFKKFIFCSNNKKICQ